MRTLKTIILIIITTAVLILFGMAAVLQEKTLVAWWIPVTVCALISIPVSLALQIIVRKLTDFKNPLWNILGAFVLSLAIFTGSFYILNYYGSDASSAETYYAPIVKKYTQERYHTKRISRNRVTRGEKYRVYFIKLEMPDGKEKKIEVSAGQYSRIKVGKRLNLQLESGLFGVTVIRNLSFPVRSRPERVR